MGTKIYVNEENIGQEFRLREIGKKEVFSLKK